MAHLVKVGDLQVGSLPDSAFVGLQLAQDHLEQRGFARAVRADQAYLVPAQDRPGKVVDDGFVAKGFAHPLQFRHDLALVPVGTTGGDVHADAAHDFAAGLPSGAQLLQAADAALAASAARFHTAPNPHFFLCQQLVGLGGDHRLLRQLLLFLDLVLGKVTRVGAQLTAVQLHDAGGYTVKERPVVGDGHDAAREVQQQVFQPLDGIQIQVVGGLVQQQHVRACHQCLCQGHALFGTAGECAHHRFRVQVQSLQGLFHALLPVPGIVGLDL